MFRTRLLLWPLKEIGRSKLGHCCRPVFVNWACDVVPKAPSLFAALETLGPWHTTVYPDLPQSKITCWIWILMFFSNIDRVGLLLHSILQAIPLTNIICSGPNQSWTDPESMWSYWFDRAPLGYDSYKYVGIRSHFGSAQPILNKKWWRDVAIALLVERLLVGRGFESRRGLSSELSFALPKIVVPAGSGQTISSESKSGVSRWLWSWGCTLNKKLVKVSRT